MYEWWVFVHVVGVFGFLATHGVSMGVLFRLRRERDPRRIEELIQLSSRSITPFYLSLGVLLVAGIVAAFLGDWWGFGWIWGAIVTLVAVSVAMYVVARPYYRRVGRIARAMAGGSQAVTPEQFDRVLRSARPPTVAGLGIAGLLFILYLMMFKPSLGLSPRPEAAPVAGPSLRIAADGLEFSTDALSAPADEEFSIVFDNREAVPHNVAIYRDASTSDALFTGEVITGPRIVTYHVSGLSSGTYFFRCDVHPSQMTGSLEAA